MVRMGEPGGKGWVAERWRVMENVREREAEGQ